MKLTTQLLIAIAALIALAWPQVTASAQEEIESEVWVTAQDFSNLRAGPSLYFEVMTVLPVGATLPATGRTIQGDWIQVVHDDGYGWIASWLLRWTGDILELPIDGVPTDLRFARRTGPIGITSREAPYYVEGIDPTTRVGYLPQATEIELTGRVGSFQNGFFWVQFVMDDQFYWIGSYDVRLPYRYGIVPDGSYLYVYGRLLGQLRTEFARVRNTLDSIGSRWRDLDAGFAVSCNNITPRITLNPEYFLSADLSVESEYVPAYRALVEAVTYANDAITRFETVCARQGEARVITPEEVQDALAVVDEGGRYLTLANTLLPPLARRDPLLGNVGEDGE